MTNIITKALNNECFKFKCIDDRQIYFTYEGKDFSFYYLNEEAILRYLKILGIEKTLKNIHRNFDAIEVMRKRETLYMYKGERTGEWFVSIYKKLPKKEVYGEAMSSKAKEEYLEVLTMLEKRTQLIVGKAIRIERSMRKK